MSDRYKHVLMYWKDSRWWPSNHIKIEMEDESGVKWSDRPIDIMPMLLLTHYRNRALPGIPRDLAVLK